MNGYTVDQRRDVGTDGWMDGWTVDEQIGGCIDGWMAGRQRDERRDGRVARALPGVREAAAEQPAANDSGGWAVTSASSAPPCRRLIICSKHNAGKQTHDIFSCKKAPRFYKRAT